jgi:p21-activated kinase 1
VYLATHKTRGEKVAIKQLQISKKNRMEYLLIETDLHARVSQHRNVVRFVDAFLLREEKQFWVVMEFIDGAPLSEVKQLEAFAEEHACWVVRNVLDALVYIHHTNRIHRDVKSANVLLSVAGEVKLTDFGLAAQLTEEMQYRKTMLGTADFMSPELLRGEAYGCKVDVWALGMMMHEMLRGATPFSTCTDPQQVLSQIEAGGVPQLKRKKLSSLAQKFVEECLRESPDARPDSATLLEHAWFKSFGPQADGACIVPLVLQVKSGDLGRPQRPGDTPTTSGCNVQ